MWNKPGACVEQEHTLHVNTVKTFHTHTHTNTLDCCEGGGVTLAVGLELIGAFPGIL